MGNGGSIASCPSLPASADRVKSRTVPWAREIVWPRGHKRPAGDVPGISQGKSHRHNPTSWPKAIHNAALGIAQEKPSRKSWIFAFAAAQRHHKHRIFMGQPGLKPRLRMLSRLLNGHWTSSHTTHRKSPPQKTGLFSSQRRHKVALPNS